AVMRGSRRILIRDGAAITIRFTGLTPPAANVHLIIKPGARRSQSARRSVGGFPIHLISTSFPSLWARDREDVAKMNENPLVLYSCSVLAFMDWIANRDGSARRF